MSFLVSCKVPGMRMAPSLCKAVAHTQYSHRRRRMSITTLPFFTPKLLKKLAALLDRRLMSVKVKIFSLSSSSHHTRAFFSGSSSAQASTTSKPKLKFSGTFTV